jgi:hypothetical protein
MPWGGSILVKSVWSPGTFLYLKEQTFLELWEVFCCYFIEYTMNPFCLTLFSFNTMILRFGLLMELVSCCIFLSQLLSCLTYISPVFPLISILSSEILSSICSSLLKCLPLCFVFLFDYFF